MVRQIVGVIVCATMATAALGCGSGVTVEEAKQLCDKMRNDGPQCVDDAAYKQCLSCQAECGDQCLTQESCPVQFACPK